MRYHGTLEDAWGVLEEALRRKDPGLFWVGLKCLITWELKREEVNRGEK